MSGVGRELFEETGVLLAAPRPGVVGARRPTETERSALSGLEVAEAAHQHAADPRQAVATVVQQRVHERAARMAPRRSGDPRDRSPARATH